MLKPPVQTFPLTRPSLLVLLAVLIAPAQEIHLLLPSLAVQRLPAGTSLGRRHLDGHRPFFCGVRRKRRLRLSLVAQALIEGRSIVRREAEQERDEQHHKSRRDLKDGLHTMPLS